MKRLYAATQHIEVIFAHDIENEGNLHRQAEHFLREEASINYQNVVSIEEIKSLDEIPNGWNDDHSIIWGMPVGEEISPKAFLLASDPEFKIYLRLKEKFE